MEMRPYRGSATIDWMGLIGRAIIVLVRKKHNKC
jgi:hypothetical protein